MFRRIILLLVVLYGSADLYTALLAFGRILYLCSVYAISPKEIIVGTETYVWLYITHIFVNIILTLKHNMNYDTLPKNYFSVH